MLTLHKAKSVYYFLVSSQIPLIEFMENRENVSLVQGCEWTISHHYSIGPIDPYLLRRSLRKPSSTFNMFDEKFEIPFRLLDRWI